MRSLKDVVEENEKKPSNPFADALREKARTSKDHTVSTVLNAIAETVDELASKDAE
jgi:hypothetical protein